MSDIVIEILRMIKQIVDSNTALELLSVYLRSTKKSRLRKQSASCIKIHFFLKISIFCAALLISGRF